MSYAPANPVAVLISTIQANVQLADMAIQAGQNQSASEYYRRAFTDCLSLPEAAMSQDLRNLCKRICVRYFVVLQQLEIAVAGAGADPKKSILRVCNKLIHYLREIMLKSSTPQNPVRENAVFQIFYPLIYLRAIYSLAKSNALEEAKQSFSAFLQDPIVKKYNKRQETLAPFIQTLKGLNLELYTACLEAYNLFLDTYIGFLLEGGQKKAQAVSSVGAASSSSAAAAVSVTADASLPSAAAANVIADAAPPAKESASLGEASSSSAAAATTNVVSQSTRTTRERKLAKLLDSIAPPVISGPRGPKRKKPESAETEPEEGKSKRPRLDPQENTSASVEPLALSQEVKAPPSPKLVSARKTAAVRKGAYVFNEAGGEGEAAPNAQASPNISL